MYWVVNWDWKLNFLLFCYFYYVLLFVFSWDWDYKYKESKLLKMNRIVYLGWYGEKNFRLELKCFLGIKKFEFYVSLIN